VRAVAAVALLLGPMAEPAAAHTALAGSVPAPGERLAYAPDEVVLTFADPVEVAATSASLRSVDGGEVPLTRATTAAVDDVVVWEVPRLGRDVYGLTWQSVGPDGHRIRGEVLFGVGVAPGDAALAAAPLDAATAATDALAVAARTAWYLALAAAAAVLVLRRGAGPLAGALARRRTAPVLALLAATALLRAASVVLTTVQAGGGLDRALTARPPLLWAAMAAVAAGAAVAARRGPAVVGMVPAGAGADHPRDGRPAPDRPDRPAEPATARALPGRAAADLLLPAVWVLTVLGGVLAGHAPTRPDPVAAVAFAVVHLGAAAVWVGPVLGLVALVRSPVWAAADSEGRRAELRAAVGATARIAGWALAAAVASGGLLAVRAWTGGQPGRGFLAALGAKAAVVALVAVPLGVLHHRHRDRWVGLPRTVRVEVAALCAALLLGSVLVAVDPGWGARGGPDAAIAALLDGAEDPAACAQLDVGRASCTRTSLAALLVEQGPQAAVDALEVLSTTDEHVMADCHQVAHDLGHDAAEQVADMGEALAVEASVCWSGYYHGFVEARLAQIPDDELAGALPSFCDGAADPRYSFTHYNCLHGLGHGLMLRGDADLFAALPLCREIGETWDVRSCASGAFMENVMAAQQGLDAEFDPTDPLHPCTAVERLGEEAVVEDCYLMQTSHILWANGGDIPAAFAACDGAPEAYRSTCYRSMGRDISSRAALQAAQVVELCEQGSPDLVPWCYDGAAANAVYDLARGDAADPLCALLDGPRRDACLAAAQQAARTVAAG
jgi:methionine-rich copper-binding protein CopC/putative copper export protein